VSCIVAGARLTDIGGAGLDRHGQRGPHEDTHPGDCIPHRLSYISCRRGVVSRENGVLHDEAVYLARGCKYASGGICLASPSDHCTPMTSSSSPAHLAPDSIRLSIHKLIQLLRCDVGQGVTWAPPEQAARAIIRAGALRRREVAYPFAQVNSIPPSNYGVRIAGAL
jgi:hypothetical protein